jgi:hypothetical protein
MISRGLFQLLLAGLSTMTLGSIAGCGSDLRGTPGQLGTLRFEYSTAGVCSGCAIDREVLAGSILDIDVHGVHPRVDYRVRSTAPEIADFQVSARCRFVGEEGCRDGIAVITNRAGDADLEVYDEWTETVLDRITIQVRDAASLDTSVKVAKNGRSTAELLPSTSGVFELAVDSDVEIVSTARSAAGTALLATNAAIKGAYADEHVIGPRPAFAGSSPTEFAKAKRPGTATVAVVGGGARQELYFRVVE